MSGRQDEGRTKFHVYSVDDDVKEFQKKEKRHEKKTSAIIILAIILVVVFALSLVLVVRYDQFSFTPAWIFNHIKDSFRGLLACLSGIDDNYGAQVIRFVAVVLIGAALAATGAVFKGSFKNSLAGPSTMGVMSGGSLGAMAYLLLFTTSTSVETIEVGTFNQAAYEGMTFWETYSYQFLILIGCFVGVGVVMLAANIAGRGRVSPTAMILAGTVLSSITSSVFMIVQYYIVLTDPSDTRIDALQDLMMGSFSKIDSPLTLLLMAVPIIVCIVIIIVLAGKLNLMALGEEEAMTMGVNVKLYRNLMIIIGTVLTAVVVAFCGRIGFLGFMVPMVARKVVGPDMKKLIPASLIIGALILLVVYDVAMVANLDSYINMFTSPIGAIVMFISLVKRRKEGKEDVTVETRNPMHMGMR